MNIGQLDKRTSWKQLDRNERERIGTLLERGESPAQIARTLNRATSTICREIKRGQALVVKKNKKTSRYDPEIAHSIAQLHAKKKGRKIKIRGDKETAKNLANLIKNKKCSPYAALRILERKGQLYTHLCVTTVYNYIYQGILDLTPEDLIYNHSKHEVKVPFHERHCCRKRQGDMSIEARPRSVLSREEFGHWECDTIVSARGGAAAILTILERKTRFLLAIWMADRTQKEVRQALDQIEVALLTWKIPSKELFKSITFDNGTEFLNGDALACSFFEDQRDADGKGGRTQNVYYCHTFASCERASNENVHRMIRRYYPKETIFDDIDLDEFYESIDNINDYPRKILNDATARERFEEECQKLVDAS